MEEIAMPSKEDRRSTACIDRIEESAPMSAELIDNGIAQDLQSLIAITPSVEKTDRCAGQHPVTVGCTR